MSSATKRPLTSWLRPLPALDAVPSPALEVRGTHCRSTIGLFAEWGGVLGFPEDFGYTWAAFEACLDAVTDPDPVTLVLCDAASLLADEEPGQLRNLLDVLGTGAFGLLLLDDTPDALRELAYRMTEAGFNTP
ncbi:barstar family protein [Streptomyces niveiscabiei]|uniref:barstar family protein n=1 Tax=Streptomyces niveiscabiei TaxID=164115 RepID=UPI0029B52AAA|nr:barstar family protein [Streptomyces niveiscabiei]MDX3384759.1 barstar family protein [Streptomyces niveiscabiei]